MWILFVFILLTSVIAVHEYGHFLMARLFKVEVDSFSIGVPFTVRFGTKVFSTPHFIFRKVKYQLSPLLLGGAVRFSLAPEKNENKLVYLENLTPWKKILVSLAGPLANIISSFFMVLVIFYSFYGMQLSQGKEPFSSNFLTHPFSERLEAQVNGTENYLKNEEKILLSKTNILSLSFFVTSDLSWFFYKKSLAIFKFENLDKLGSILGIFGASKQIDNDKEKLSEKFNLDKDFKKFFSFALYFIIFPFAFVVISLSIGVFNLLPIPLFDGGHIISSAFRQLFIWFKIDTTGYYWGQLRYVLTAMGMLAILSLMVIAFKNDINNFWLHKIEEESKVNNK